MEKETIGKIRTGFQELRTKLSSQNLNISTDMSSIGSTITTSNQRSSTLPKESKVTIDPLPAMCNNIAQHLPTQNCNENEYCGEEQSNATHTPSLNKITTPLRSHVTPRNSYNKRDVQGFSSSSNRTPPIEESREYHAQSTPHHSSDERKSGGHVQSGGDDLLGFLEERAQNPQRAVYPNQRQPPPLSCTSTSASSVSSGDRGTFRRPSSTRSQNHQSTRGRNSSSTRRSRTSPSLQLYTGTPPSSDGLTREKTQEFESEGDVSSVNHQVNTQSYNTDNHSRADDTFRTGYSSSQPQPAFTLDEFSDSFDTRHSIVTDTTGTNGSYKNMYSGMKSGWKNGMVRVGSHSPDEDSMASLRRRYNVEKNKYSVPSESSRSPMGSDE